jgi:stage V sporulation protein G
VVTCTVLNARPVTSKTLFALVDVEVLIDEVAFVICGIQARREPDGRTAVTLPTYRAADGAWLPAIKLPSELRTPIADAVLEHLVDEGIAKRRF